MRPVAVPNGSYCSRKRKTILQYERCAPQNWAPRHPKAYLASKWVREGNGIAGNFLMLLFDVYSCTHTHNRTLNVPPFHFLLFPQKRDPPQPNLSGIAQTQAVGINGCRISPIGLVASVDRVPRAGY
jgi:hypothetical protein